MIKWLSRQGTQIFQFGIYNSSYSFFCSNFLAGFGQIQEAQGKKENVILVCMCACVCMYVCRGGGVKACMCIESLGSEWGLKCGTLLCLQDLSGAHHIGSTICLTTPKMATARTAQENDKWKLCHVPRVEHHGHKIMVSFHTISKLMKLYGSDAMN